MPLFPIPAPAAESKSKKNLTEDAETPAAEATPAAEPAAEAAAKAAKKAAKKAKKAAAAAEEEV